MGTPLINALRVQGGTFYTFSSSASDIAKTFTDDDIKFAFSKFALLNIPNVATPSGTNYENFLVWEGLGSYLGGTAIGNSSVPATDLNSDNDIDFAQSFQNYVLNFEDAILNGNNTLNQAYDNTQLYTVCERIFWKWLTQLNVIRFRGASTTESTQLDNLVELDQTPYYSKVVKYIGDIDIVNNVSREGYAYSEVYLNVPVGHGSTPVVLFESLQDANYAPEMSWVGSTYVDGYSSSSIHPTGLSLFSYFDDKNTLSYNTQPVFGSTGIWTGTASTISTSPKPVQISLADGLILDTNASDYYGIANNPAITSISEYNTTPASQDFSFNVALVYYDIYSQSNPSSRGRNLYGVLILDNYINQTSGSNLPAFDKFKPNAITKLNGNGYGLKLNFKFDTSVSNVGVETIINDYNTFSMDLFIDASTRLQEAADLFIAQNQNVIDIQQQISNLNQYYFSQPTINTLSQRVSVLESSLNNASLAYQSSTTLLDLINNNADNINKILSGNLSVNLTYNTNVLGAGNGILLDTSVPNKVKINNRVQNYYNFMVCNNTSGFIQTTAKNGLTLTDTGDNNIIVLGLFTNYFRQSNTVADPTTGIETFSDDVYININDNPIRWKNGQTLRFVFSQPINANNFNIIFTTDSQNIFGGGSYGKIIGKIPAASLISAYPIFEIICTDENQYLFNIDILR